MKYLKIENKGELDIRLIALMGGTTKADNPNKIGQFGTGLKYAIAWLVRNENAFKLFVGEKELKFEARNETISQHEFKEIYLNGKTMNITTHYGYQWKAWEAIREIWCNAKDEGKELKQVVEIDEPKGKANKTTFFIELTEEIQTLLDTWGDYFLEASPLFENKDIAIYINNSEKLRVYKNRVLIKTDTYYNSMFVYDIKDATLNELRQYMGYANSDIAKGILASNKDVIDMLLAQYKRGGDILELKLDYTYTKYKKEHVKDIFSGYLFIHPDSDGSKGEKSVKVSKSLFQILQECGCPSEKVATERGRYYGGSGSGYEDDTEISYSEIVHGDLQNRIQKILDKYKSDMEFTIVIPRDSDFEILATDSNEVLFSADLLKSSDADLEAVVLVGIFHTKEGNIFKALKRLIKFARSNKAFEKIFFGSI